MYAPRSSAIWPGTAVRGASAPKRKTFQRSRFACQGRTHFSCSGKRVGSAAAANASPARIAEAVWLPWPPSPVAGKRVTITSGRKDRMIHTTSDRTCSWPQIANVSSGFFE